MQKNLIPQIVNTFNLTLNEQFTVIDKNGVERACKFVTGALIVIGQDYDFGKKLLADIICGDAKIENGIITLGDKTITPITNLGNVAKTNTANTWTAPQEFQQVKVIYENYFSVVVSGTSHTPKSSVMYYNATGAFTLDLSVIVSNLSPSASTVFTAFFKSTGDYTLTIEGAGAIKYTGSASDVALTNTGLLLNILIVKDANANVTSIVQASKLS